MKKDKKGQKGRLRIGNNWNAITIIALSQNNPLKAIAEFVENSIDAKAKHITIVRGKKNSENYLKIIDDGMGIPKDDKGAPNFHYVATHICDSMKRELKRHGSKNIQGEFGIGLLSFWTVGETLTLISSGEDGRTYQMTMAKGDSDYRIAMKRTLFSDQGTELIIRPLLPGLRQLTGEKIQRYLASELRDRIKKTGVDIKILDRTSRVELKVEPRQFEGQLLHNLPLCKTQHGEIYIEFYLNDLSSQNRISLHRSGTRVLPSITDLDHFAHEPWTSGYIQGIVDVPFLNLTPGTRDGVIQDSYFEHFVHSLEPIRDSLRILIEEQQRAEEEKASRHILKTVQKAFHEAFHRLPQEEYDWFDIQTQKKRRSQFLQTEQHADTSDADDEAPSLMMTEFTGKKQGDLSQKDFFEFSGPLYSVIITPTSSVVAVGKERAFRVIARDRCHRQVEEGLRLTWEVLEGGGVFVSENTHQEIIRFQAPQEPGLCRIRVIAEQGQTMCENESIITVIDSILPETKTAPDGKKGLPGYTLKRAPSELWRSKYDSEKNIILINNGHRDFVYASQSKARKLRYICRLFSKELIQNNSPELSVDQRLERMVELSLYTEEYLK